MPGWTRRAVLALVSILDATDVTTHAACAEDPLQGSSVPSALIFAAYGYLGPGPRQGSAGPRPQVPRSDTLDRAGFKIKILSLRTRAPGPRSDAGRVQAPAIRPQAVGKRVYGPRFSMTEDGERTVDGTRGGQALSRRPSVANRGSKIYQGITDAAPIRSRAGMLPGQKTPGQETPA